MEAMSVAALPSDLLAAIFCAAGHKPQARCPAAPKHLPEACVRV